MNDVLSLRDKKLLDLFGEGLSPQEVEEAMGVPAAKALARCKEILKSRDVFDQIEARQLLVGRMDALYRQGHALLEATGVKDWPKGVEALTKLLKEIRETKNTEELRSLAEIEAMTKAQAAVLIRAVQMSYERARDLLAAEYPEVNVERIDEAFNSGLLELASERV